MGGAKGYFQFVWNSFSTVCTGLRITWKYFVKSLFGGDSTLEYPDERPVVSDRYRGIHILDVETCIACLQCARACPIDCITIRADRNKETKEVVFHEFSIDYNKCMFCHLCIEPCPVQCIEMSRTVEFNVFDRQDLVLDLRLPMHQYNSKSPEGVVKGRETTFIPGFNNTIFNILKPHEAFEGQQWSRTDGRRVHVHENPTARLTGVAAGAKAPEKKD